MGEKGQYLDILNRKDAPRFGKVRIVGTGINEIITIEAALAQAEDVGLDLVLVSDEASPPVVRVQDFKKIEYEKKKARKASLKSQSILKEIQFKVNISDHDLGTKLAKINKFLEKGDKVRIQVRLKGRERENPERAFQLLTRITEATQARITPIPGPVAMALLEPMKLQK